LDKIKSDFRNIRAHGIENLSSEKIEYSIPDNKRIDYWFPGLQKNDLAIILSRIRSVGSEIMQRFLLCAFSNILKQCSRWMMSSVKPTVDRDKVIADAYRSFENQTKRMMIKNEELWKRIGELDVDCQIEESDAREIGLSDSSTAFIVTSPPYVTSYEYGDIHQLSAIWLNYTRDIAQFSSKFIGSNKRRRANVEIRSEVGRKIVERLNKIDQRAANSVEHYFSDMQECFQEMYRILRRGGRLSIVVGDTELRRVKIQNSDFFSDSMQLLGFNRLKLIQRQIPRKILPLTRDEATGRFVASAQANRLAYPTEHILIMEKI
jgi:SAM-dependent methyltransferase